MKFETFKKSVEKLSEENAKELVEIIYPDRRGIRACIRPIARSYKKRLLYNLKHYWRNVDIDKLENKFQQLGFSIF